MVSIIQSDAKTSAEVNFSAQNFHNTFLMFAHALNSDDKIQKAEFEQRILEKLDHYRLNESRFNPHYDPSRKGKKAISFEEFAMLRYEFGLPFANNGVGYWVKDKEDTIFTIRRNCGLTVQSGELEIGNYVDLLNKQIQQYSGEDISNGVSESALRKYYNQRMDQGLEKSKITNYNGNYWSQPYDVGSSEIGACSNTDIRP